MKAITKKIDDEIFIWDPTAYQNKGYWYVLGTKGAYGRPASKKERLKLGTPPSTETEPESPDVLVESNTTRSKEYKKTKKDKTPLSDKVFEKWFQEGEGLGSAVKSGISEKFQLKTTGLKEKFDPLNIATKVFGKKIGAMIGREQGRTDEDIEYFTGYGKNKGTSSAKEVSGTKSSTAKKLGKIDFEKLNNALYTKTGGSETSARAGDGVATVLAKLYNLIKNNNNDEIKQSKLDKSVTKEKLAIREKWHQEIIDAITGQSDDPTKLNTKSFNVFKKEIYDKIKELAEAITGGGTSVSDIVSTAATAATPLIGEAAILGAGTILGGASIATAAVTGVVLQKEQKEAIEKDPWNPKFDNIPYALTKRGVTKTDGEAAKLLKDRAIKQIPYQTVDEMYKLDDGETAEEEIGLPKEKIKEFLDNPENKKRNIQSIPKSERLKSEKSKTEVSTEVQTVEASEPTATIVPKFDPYELNEEVKPRLTKSKMNGLNFKSKSSSASKVEDSKVSSKEILDKLGPDTENESKKSVNSAVNTASDVSPVALAENKVTPQNNNTELPSSLKEVQIENDIGNRAQNVISENNDLTLESGGSSSAVVMDNSSKINIINNNNSDFMVETIAGVRLDDTTWKKVMIGNYRWV
jgi:hypothetical protein